MISDDAFLTAAHCILPPEPILPPNVTWAVTLAAGSPADPIEHGGFDYPACCMLTVPASEIVYATGVMVDPDYDPASYTHKTETSMILLSSSSRPARLRASRRSTSCVPPISPLAGTAGDPA